METFLSRNPRNLRRDRHRSKKCAAYDSIKIRAGSSRLYNAGRRSTKAAFEWVDVVRDRASFFVNVVVEKMEGRWEGREGKLPGWGLEPQTCGL